MLFRTGTGSGVVSDWSVVPSVDPNPLNNSFNGVAALSPTDVWAVGWTSSGPLTEHWNGKAWKVVANPGPAGGSLNGVYAVSARDIWAVGSVFSNNNRHTLVEHWNGSVWSVVASPAAGTLNAVTAAAANEVWAVGSNFNAATQTNQVVIEHWEGKGWKVVSGDNPGTGGNFLNGVAAITAHEVWAVGYSTTAFPRSSIVTPQSVPNPVTQTLIEYWNGKAWKAVASPNVGTNGGALKGVVVVNKDNVWAVGVSAAYPSSFAWRTLVEHWNGRSWKIDLSPNVGYNGSILFGVTRIPNTEKLWAVGAYNLPSAYLRTLTEYSD